MFEKTKKAIATAKNVAAMTPGQAAKAAVVGTAMGVLKGGQAAAKAMGAKRRSNAIHFLPVGPAVNRIAMAAKHTPNKLHEEMLDEMTVRYDPDVKLIWVNVVKQPKLEAVHDALDLYQIDNKIQTHGTFKAIRVTVEAGLKAVSPV